MAVRNPVGSFKPICCVPSQIITFTSTLSSDSTSIRFPLQDFNMSQVLRSLLEHAALEPKKSVFKYIYLVAAGEIYHSSHTVNIYKEIDVFLLLLVLLGFCY